MKYSLLFCAALLMTAALSAGCISMDVSYPETSSEMSSILNEITVVMRNETDELTSQMSESSQVLSRQVLWSGEFDQTLKRLYAEVPYALSVIYENYSDGRYTGYPVGTEPAFAYAENAASGTEDSSLVMFTSPAHGEILVVSVPVFGQDGNICGGLYCSIEVMAIPDIACSAVPESKGYYLTIGSEASGRLIYHSYPELVGTDVPYAVYDVLDDAGEYSFVDRQGVPTSAVYRKGVFFNEKIIISLNLRGSSLAEVEFENPDMISRHGMSSYVWGEYSASGSYTAGALMTYVNGLQKDGRKYPLFFMQTDGTMLASTDRNFEGRDLRGNLDAYRVPVQQVNAVTALRGGGYSLSYIMVSPETALFEAMPVLHYVQMVDTDSYLLSYIPLSDELQDISLTKKYAVDKASSDSLLYAMQYGEQALFDAVTAGKMAYADDIGCIVLAHDGVLLADSLYPEHVGIDGNGMVDAFDTSFGRNVVTMADEYGRCNMYCCVLHPSKDGKIVICLCSLELLSGTGVVCAMAPVAEVDAL